MYFNIEKEVERANKTIKYPQKEVVEARKNLEKLYYYVQILKNNGIKDNDLRDTIDKEFAQEIHKYFETTGMEFMQIEECALEILSANPQLVEKIYNKVKEDVEQLDIEKERVKIMDSQELGLEFEMELIIKKVREEKIDNELRNTLGKVVDLENKTIKKEYKSQIEKDPKLKDSIEYLMIFLEETEIEKMKKLINYRKEKIREELIEADKKSMLISGKFFKKYNFFEDFLERQNEDYRKLGLNQMKYKLKTEQDETDIGLENIFTEEYLNTITFEQLTVLNAFWQNRYTKAIEKIREATFIADTLNIWNELEKGDYKVNITDEQIMNCILKMKVLDDIYRKISNNVKKEYVEEEYYNYAKIDIKKIVESKSQIEYKEYFNQILPTSDNLIDRNLSGNQSLRDNVKATYENKNNMIMKLLQQIEYNQKITNWGYIEETKKNIEDGKVLIGIDYPGFNMPLRLHTNRKDLVKFLKEYKNSTVIPIYEGNADMIYKGKMLKSSIFMPLTEERETKIIEENKKINPVDLKYNYIRHMGNLVTKKTKKIQKIYSREYIDLETNQKVTKVNGKFELVEENDKTNIEVEK